MGAVKSWKQRASDSYAQRGDEACLSGSLSVPILRVMLGTIREEGATRRDRALSAICMSALVVGVAGFVLAHAQGHADTGCQDDSVLIPFLNSSGLSTSARLPNCAAVNVVWGVGTAMACLGILVVLGCGVMLFFRPHKDGHRPPTTAGGKPIVGTGRIRYRVLGVRRSLVFVVAVLGAGGAGTALVSAAGQPEKPPTASQVRLVSSWLEGLRLPVGWRVDPTQTPCMTTGILCITASTYPRVLASEIKSLYQAAGASAQRIQCLDFSGSLDATPACGLSASYRGVSISVETGVRYAYRQPSSWAVELISDEPYTPPLESGSFPAQRAIRATPRSWHVQMRCVTRLDDRCQRYEGDINRPGSARSSIRTLVNSLTAAEYRIDEAQCFPLPNAERCAVAAAKNFAPDGGDEIEVTSILTNTRNGTATGQLFIGGL